MESYEIGIFLIIEILNIFLACFLIYYLYKKKNQFPYANVSPLWIITFIIGKIKFNIQPF